MNNSLFSNRLITKLILSSIGILLLAGIGYMLSTLYYSNKYFSETNQRLHAHLAQDLIDEKFVEQSPIDSLGKVNKALFGDLMHDMMAVNRAIEVYLLDVEGNVQYSVVLDHSDPNSIPEKVSLEPIHRFIASNGEDYILGDDPRDPENKKVFSAAKFNKGGKEGYIYIVLAGEKYLATQNTLFGSYALKVGLGASFLTLFFAAVLGVLSIWYLTKNLREINYAAQRFQQGDLGYRIAEHHKTDLTGLAQTYNNMAETILTDMDKIKSLEKLRRDLIANISHDLRTPLAIIQGYIETLQMKESELTPVEREDYLNKINSSGERLSKLITQLFEYSKLEANQVEPQKEPFLISELANDIHRDYQMLANKKNIALKLNMEEHVPLVFADISLVERAIQNLMDNALKFTPENGEVIIEIKLVKKNVEIAIKDSGPGITKENQQLVFERYRQTKTGKEKEGAGLGLAIVRKIIELHDASIKVFSRPNEGTTFSFSLPVYQNGLSLV
ncbi:HAMP domain-containing histidine kinase [Muricauda sp. SCSIO 64092]|uniref:sensor histidine kinase n=1 Tax=Allomuricauda sp. SCSIO 64092 TaxID=2908842 RepID=UPI001FF4A561|nr:HAMP domain-containing sensor histidine kinase [Muricauda sp. SCSIO 64092]UOY07666.1 HAMP domain-containing histidine kinase [Muricauda sp. SCSIO 64092]